MIAVEIIRQVIVAGGQITADGADLVLTAPRPLPAELLDGLKAHKPDILAAHGPRHRSDRLAFRRWATVRWPGRSEP